jgi:cytochrome P450
VLRPFPITSHFFATQSVADVLSSLTQARDDENHGMTDTELVGQAAILFGASYETTASTLTWTLFLLAQHPKIYAQRCAREYS